MNGYIAEPLADDEGDSHAAAGKGSTSPFEADLELLRALVRGAVVLRGSEEAGVVAQAQSLHQRGDELLGGKAAKGVMSGVPAAIRLELRPASRRLPAARSVIARLKRSARPLAPGRGGLPYFERFDLPIC